MAKDYFVAAQHRPRRVAFLVDVDQSPEELFNEIVDFNVSSWGGRYNPVIPVVDGTIPEPYWPLLQLIDADILYSYCDIATAGLRRIARDLQPLDVLRHNPESNSSRARINYQASALPVLTRVMQQFPTWARSPEPAVLTFDYKDTRSVSSFLRRNFGWSDQYFFWCRDHQIPNARMVPDDKDVMMALYSNRNLLMPIDICGVGPRKLRAARLPARPAEHSSSSSQST